MSKNIGKNKMKNLSGNYSQQFLDNTKKIASEALKAALNIVIPETAEATGDLIGKIITDKIKKNWTQNNSDTGWQTDTLIDMHIYIYIYIYIYIQKKGGSKKNMNLLDNTPNQPSKFRTKV